MDDPSIFDAILESREKTHRNGNVIAPIAVGCDANSLNETYRIIDSPFSVVIEKAEQKKESSILGGNFIEYVICFTRLKDGETFRSHKRYSELKNWYHQMIDECIICGDGDLQFPEYKIKYFGSSNPDGVVAQKRIQELQTFLRWLFASSPGLIFQPKCVEFFELQKFHVVKVSSLITPQFLDTLSPSNFLVDINSTPRTQQYPYIHGNNHNLIEESYSASSIPPSHCHDDSSDLFSSLFGSSMPVNSPSYDLSTNSKPTHDWDAIMNLDNKSQNPNHSHFFVKDNWESEHQGFDWKQSSQPSHSTDLEFMDIYLK